MRLWQGFQQPTREQAEELFNQLFGGGDGRFSGFGDMFEQQARQARQRGADLQAHLRITLREAASGVTKTINIPIRNINGGREDRRVEVNIPAGLPHSTA